ncbi:membrane protein [Streptomyces sp. NRRL S-104]|nr:membrane protein [Streptomyces sp. NRRL S-104]
MGGARPNSAAPAARRDGFGARNGWLLFAGFLMVFGGLMMLFSGISAIAKDDLFISTPHYAYEFDLTSWGWIHLVLGIVVLLAGLAVIRGALWARIVGLALAGLSMVASFMWLPYTPFWALVLLAIDGLIVWALCTAPGLTGD